MTENPLQFSPFLQVLCHGGRIDDLVPGVKVKDGAVDRLVSGLVNAARM